MTTKSRLSAAADQPMEWLSPADLAEELHISRQNIYRWRMEGKGPRGHMIGRHVRFSRESINAWLEQQADPKSAA